jgi:hypothetical protein
VPGTVLHIFMLVRAVRLIVFAADKPADAVLL